MTSADARSLIEKALPDKVKSTWIDLGCGSGTFTYALADLLGDGSKIIAIDRLNQHLGTKRGKVELEFVQADFEMQNLMYEQLDGILIANALHFVKDHFRFIERIRPWLKHGGKLIIIEYDTDKGNQWVPFPLTYERTSQLLKDAGFVNIVKVGEKDSVYQSGKMFVCSCEK